MQFIVDRHCLFHYYIHNSCNFSFYLLLCNFPCIFIASSISLFLQLFLRILAVQFLVFLPLFYYNIEFTSHLVFCNIIFEFLSVSICAILYLDRFYLTAHKFRLTCLPQYYLTYNESVLLQIKAAYIFLLNCPMIESTNFVSPLLKWIFVL